MRQQQPKQRQRGTLGVALQVFRQGYLHRLLAHDAPDHLLLVAHFQRGR